MSAGQDQGQDQEQEQEQAAGLPQADGPLVKVRLPDAIASTP